jgi:hypothetical protein
MSNIKQPCNLIVMRTYLAPLQFRQLTLLQSSSLVAIQESALHSLSSAVREPLLLAFGKATGILCLPDASRNFFFQLGSDLGAEMEFKGFARLGLPVTSLKVGFDGADLKLFCA